MLVLLLALLQDQVDNPEYKAWASFKPGSWVKRETLWAREKPYEIKLVLKSVSENELQVEMTAPVIDQPKPVIRDVGITARVPAPGTKYLAEGNQEIEVAGRKLRCHWVEYEINSPIHGPQVTREWTSGEVPGGTVRIDDRRKNPSDSAWETRMITTAWEKK